MNLRVAYFLATVGGIGRFRPAPGTLGTVAAVPIYVLLAERGPWWVVAAGLATAAIGVLVAATVSAAERDPDPQHVVIDEVAGALVALATAPPSLVGLIATIVLFRLFDTLKPWPIRWCEQLPGGFGIVVDDLVAGAWTALVVYLARRLAQFT